jgi:hypothetical protein
MPGGKEGAQSETRTSFSQGEKNAFDEVRARAGEVKVVAEHLWRLEL